MSFFFSFGCIIIGVCRMSEHACHSTHAASEDTQWSQLSLYTFMWVPKSSLGSSVLLSGLNSPWDWSSAVCLLSKEAQKFTEQGGVALLPKEPHNLFKFFLL